MIALVNLNLDFDGTVVIGTKRACGELVRKGVDETFKIFWHAELLGWIVCRKQGTKKMAESALVYETNVADLYRPIWVSWPRLP